MGFGQYSGTRYAGKKWKAEEQLAGERAAWFRKAGHNRVIWKDAIGEVRFRLHLTDVVIWHLDGSVTVQTGGYETLTTRAAIMDALPGFVASGNRNRTHLRRTSDGQEWILEGGKATIAARYGVKPLRALNDC